MPGSHSWQLHPEIERRSHDRLIEKTLPGSFTGTELGDVLDEAAVDTVSITGYMTHMCVDTTARQAAHRGLSVEILNDATGTLPLANSGGSATGEELHRSTPGWWRSQPLSGTRADDRRLPSFDRLPFVRSACGRMRRKRCSCGRVASLRARVSSPNPLPKGEERVRRKAVLAVVLASSAGLLAAGAQASSAHSSTHAAKPTVITVVAGKPSELAFQLSESTNLKVGTYTFKVTNKGLGYHTFKFCTTPVKTGAKNTCAGKVTKTLHPGQTASLTVKITKTGKYEYLCSIPGHAAGGMKGLIGVGVKVKPAPKPPKTTTPTTTSPTTTTTTTTTTGGALTANGCPAGTPAGTTIGSDEDGDESGTGTDDGDGCL